MQEVFKGIRQFSKGKKFANKCKSFLGDASESKNVVMLGTFENESKNTETKFP